MRPYSLAVRLGLGLAALLGGCSNKADATATPEARSYQPLVMLTDWTSVSRDQDPFVTDTVAAPACVGPGFLIEQDTNWVEIDTGLCNWVTLKASARAAV